MTTISDQQAIEYAYAGGWRGSNLIDIVAIANAESTLNTNPPGNPTHYGILQFDAPTAQNVGFSISDVLDPQKAFAAAYKLFQKRGFTPWKSWWGPAYQGYDSRALQFVPQVKNDLAKLGGQSALTKNPNIHLQSPGTTDPLGQLGNDVGGMGSGIASGITGGMQSATSGLLSGITTLVKDLLPHVILLGRYIHRLFCACP